MYTTASKFTTTSVLKIKICSEWVRERSSVEVCKT